MPHLLTVIIAAIKYLLRGENGERCTQIDIGWSV